ncbi:MAG: hypothetical protein A3H02_01160 [Candidatus Niyogibacteria bacterium RIFCSPLOWO2_12_FULL_41_13]|uniref:Methyltransferase domain-containing protein n=1 Tax=Candidatus Niyogibacteria bacterium RIFCSPLOWO2_12_FULL_41_13 TaxID=1801726 RepID=A0A1G2F3Z3_9BACT|nr:MAG: hypothetical protein A3H02_01160 [Candidatus Niyogibacteria bacterium RIFCSPLOWO2_12_FULL_41_13]
MFIDPTQIIDSLDIEPGMKIADFGSGAGFYAIALAKKAGEGGKVYAVDIQKNMLEMVRSKSRLNHLLNIETVWADLEKANSTRLKEDSIDFILISSVLFQIENKKNLLDEARRILKPNGKVAVAEWEKNAPKIGPPAEHRLSSEETRNLFLENGFKLDKEVYAGEYHYGLVFRK